MAKPRLSMRKIKEVLRLSYQLSLSARQIALSANVSRSTVKDYLVRAERAGIDWPTAESLTEQQIDERLFPSKPFEACAPKALPDFDYIYQELKAHKKFNLTLDLLWRGDKQKKTRRYREWGFCAR